MSWARRSFLLIRKHPLLLLSSLRPACRHGSQLSTVFGHNKPISLRGYASKSNADPQAKVKRHLYLVLDDHEDGYGVHKLDLSDDDDDDHLDSGSVRRLPSSALSSRPSESACSSPPWAAASSLQALLFETP